MSLLLSGGGDSHCVVPLDELFISHIDLDKTVLYIPVAMEASVFSYEQCLDWFTSTYLPFGITNVEMCTDLCLISSLHKYAAVFIGGGNTFKLLKAIKESRLDVRLTDYFNSGGFIYGGSAGAIIFGKTIKPALHADANNVGLEDLTGLNLVHGYDIWCHYSDKDNDYIKDYDNDLYILYEESGLYIHNNKIDGIGKLFLKKCLREVTILSEVNACDS